MVIRPYDSNQRVLEIDHGAMTVYDGDYDYYLHKSGREAHGG